MRRSPVGGAHRTLYLSLRVLRYARRKRDHLATGARINSDTFLTLGLTAARPLLRTRLDRDRGG